MTYVLKTMEKLDILFDNKMGWWHYIIEQEIIRSSLVFTENFWTFDILIFENSSILETSLW